MDQRHGTLANWISEKPFETSALKGADGEDQMNRYNAERGWILESEE
jgi:hypothetical protein